MNRRNLILSSSAAFASISHGALAQRSAVSSDVLTSELTGGQVDISGTSLELTQQHIDDADGSEHFHFAIENNGQFDIYFWPHASGDAAQMVEGLVDMFFTVMPEAELLGSDEFDDGGYIAFSDSQVSYYEYQRNAYPDHDLILLFFADAAIFEENFNAAQAIMIDGMAPFLFQDEAGILELAAAQVEATSTGTAQTTSRTTRNSNTAKPEETTNTRSSRSSTEPSSSSGDDPVDAVIAHREMFWNSYTEFYELLEILASDGATQAEIDDSWAMMLDISLQWQNYPIEAAEIVFSTDQATLESAYVDWANGVELMGVTFEQFALDETTIDEVIAANDALIALDELLLAELGGLGNSYKHNRTAVAWEQMKGRVKTLA